MKNDNHIVKLSEGFLLEHIDGEIAVYHPTLATSLYLNDTGALIWELCDGKRCIAEIIEILTTAYPESAERIGDDVRALIDRLVANQIAELHLNA